MSQSNSYLNFIFYIFVALLNLHLLRNIIPGYETILISFLLLSMLISFNRLDFDSYDIIYWLFITILFMSLYVVLITLLNKDFNNEAISLGKTLNAAARLFLMPLTALLFFIYIKKDIQLFHILNIFVIISIFAALSYVYQYYFGAIDWFAEGSGQSRGRGFNVRFASLHGSITVSAVTLSLAFIATVYLYKSYLLRFIILSILAMGLIMSLQKASIFNVVLIFGLIIFFSKNRILLLMIYSIAFLILYYAFLYLYNLNDELIIISHINDIVNHTISMNLLQSNDGADSFSFRLYGGAMNMMNEYGWQMVIYGKGFVGAGATMGIEGGQAHNTFWDLVFMGGIIYLLSFLILITIIMLRLYKIKSKYSKLLLIANIIFIINGLQGSILFFQPVTSFIFWVSLVYVSRQFQKRSIE